MSKKPHGFWKDFDNVLSESKDFIENHGIANFTARGLISNNASSLSKAITAHGGFDRLTSTLDVQVDHTKTKTEGYWLEINNVLKECKRYLKNHSPKELSQKKLRDNGFSSLATGISNVGGYTKIKSRLFLPTRAPTGFWKDKENILNSSGVFIEEHGAENFVGDYINEHAPGLLSAIYKHGGIKRILRDLNIDVITKPHNYYSDKDNLLADCKDWIDTNGVDKFSIPFFIELKAPFRNAIQRHGGLKAVRISLGLNPTLYSRTSASKRIINLVALKKTLTNLKIEGVAGLAPAQMLILLQQGGFDELPLVQGGDLFAAIASGALTPQGLIDWGNSDEAEPVIGPTEEQVNGEPQPLLSEEDVNDAVVGGINIKNLLSEESEEESQAPIVQPTHREEEDTSLSPLALMDAENQLRFLDGVVFASDDQEAVDALKSITLHQLWAKAYLSPEDEAAVVRSAQAHQSSKPWTAEVQQEFLATYEAAKNLALPDGYNYRVDGELVEPRLMQKHVAVLAHKHRQFLVMSDMGSGKSLSAQLAVKTDRSKRILVIPINSCVEQWVSDFKNQWKGNKVLRLDRNFLQQLAQGAQVFIAENDCAIWVLPAHLLSLMRDEEVAALAQTLQPDAVVLDEIHIFKTRDSEAESKRRTQTKKLLALIAEQTPNRLVLGLSGTIIVNSLTEGKALLELATGEERDDLPTGTGLNQAMRMHQALMATGIRQKLENDFTVHIHRPQVDASYLIDEVRSALSYPPRMRPLKLERVLIEARIPEVLKAVGDQPTVVATQYVEGFVDPLRDALTDAGYSVGVHSGKEKFPVAGYPDAIEAFKAGAVQVLVGSIQTICTGIDGLQKSCSNMVIASLPWTAADYNQLIARLARHHQTTDVTVHIPSTHIDYFDDKEGTTMTWSFCAYRQALLDSKQRLMDAVLDGMLPPEALSGMTEAKVGKKLTTWLSRLTEDGALVRPVKEIRIPLVFSDPSEEVKVRKHYGSFSTMNGHWNTSRSSTLHQRLKTDPTAFALYHTDLSELRKDWVVDPLQEAINFLAKSEGQMVGDFGCGQAQLAEALQGRHTVYSFDHVAVNETVTVCDCAEHVPLTDDVLDYAVFSLSLMGTNRYDQLTEAKRVLKAAGQILIWDPAKDRDLKTYTDEIESRGFKVLQQQENFKWVHTWAIADPSNPGISKSETT